MENFSSGFWSQDCMKYYSPYLKKVVGKLTFASQTHIWSNRSVGHGMSELFFWNISYYTWNDFLDCLQFEDYYCTLYLFRSKNLVFSVWKTGRPHPHACYLVTKTLSRKCIELFAVWSVVPSVKKNIGFFITGQMLKNMSECVRHINLNLRSQKKKFWIIQVALIVHHTPTMTCHGILWINIVFSQTKTCYSKNSYIHWDEIRFGT